MILPSLPPSKALQAICPLVESPQPFAPWQGAPSYLPPGEILPAICPLTRCYKAICPQVKCPQLSAPWQGPSSFLPPCDILSICKLQPGRWEYPAAVICFDYGGCAHSQLFARLRVGQTYRVCVSALTLLTVIHSVSPHCHPFTLFPPFSYHPHTFTCACAS